MTAVYQEAGGTLDFYYQITNNPTSTNCGTAFKPACDPLARETSVSFSGSTTALGFRTDGGALGGFSSFVNGTVHPVAGDRDAGGDVIGFSFGPPDAARIQPGQTSNVLVISTNATTFTSGGATVSDGGTFTVAAFAPAPVTPTPTVTGTLATSTPTAGAQPLCVGDCNDDGSVSVAELITLVNIALGNAQQTCVDGVPVGDTVNVSLIVRAVGNALNGCQPQTGIAFTVNTVNDAVADFAGDVDFSVCQTAPNNGVCTLRAAVMTANRHSGGATIRLPAGTYPIQFLPTGPDDDASGDLNITGAVTIVGADAATTVVDGGGTDRVFRVEPPGALTMSGVTVRNGNAALGGGIANLGQLNLTDSVITANHSGQQGGGVYAVGPTTLTQVTIEGNTSVIDAGGIMTGKALTLTDSTVDDNHAGGAGGGLLNDGSLTIFNSTISDNTAAFDGGGVANNGAAQFFHTTVAGNLSDSAAAGGYVGGGISNFAPLQLWNTLLADNYNASTLSNCFGMPLTSEDYNYFQTTAGCVINGVTTHNVIGGDPLLASLADNGGATQTRALLAGSPAIDQIPTALCRDPSGAAPVPDQRGVLRPVGPLCDIGAYEGQQAGLGYMRNLVRNGDAEAAAGSPSGAFVGVPNWRAGAPQMSMTVVPYDAPGGFPSLATDTVPAVHGRNFFAGGGSGVAVSVQDVDLSPLAASIDAGSVSYDCSADLGGYLDQEDNATVEYDFLDQATHLLSQVILGPVTAADRSHLTGLLHQEATGAVPAQSRSVEMIVTLSRVTGPGNDGYADNISLVLLLAAGG